MALGAVAATLALAPPARAYHEGEERIVDQTGHTLRARETRLGMWELEFAPVAFATVGTDTAPWAAGILFRSVVANGHVKLRLLRTTPLTVSVGAAVYYADVPAQGPVLSGSGSLLLVPLSVFASSDLSHDISLHFGATYAYADAGDLAIDVGSYRVRADMVASALQLHAMGEYRLTRVVAFTLQVHGQPQVPRATLRTSATDDFGDRIDFTGTVRPVNRAGVSAVASVVFSGRNLNLRFGGGYGAIFIPSMGGSIPIATFIPELDAYVRF